MIFKKRFWVIAACLPAIPAWASETALLRCRAIADPMQRFACYEAIPVPATSSPAGAPTAKDPPKPASRPSPPPAAAPAGNGNAAAGFGLPERPPEIVRIESAVQGKFQGWEPNTRIRLANGQVWQIVDDSSAYCNCDHRKVAVRRGALGAFYLEIDGSNRSPRVKRVE